MKIKFIPAHNNLPAGFARDKQNGYGPDAALPVPVSSHATYTAPLSEILKKQNYY
ncbi:hypothetical protein [Niabella beijingensis]|uniref:hypothetical protein n=1 Tax=Niabella beijingensis TaxID=2872700 RepID=UPI0023E45142|nr:hypothetical protein [Niabella beijingensis]